MKPNEWLRSAGLVVVLVGACALSPPEIGRNLSGTWAEANQVFDARVKQRFPVGSAAADVVAELTREGFTIHSDRGVPAGFNSLAVVDKPGLPCRLYWKIMWSAEAGRLTGIAGTYSGTCL